MTKFRHSIFMVNSKFWFIGVLNVNGNNEFVGNDLCVIPFDGR